MEITHDILIAMGFFKPQDGNFYCMALTESGWSLNDPSKETVFVQKHNDRWMSMFFDKDGDCLELGSPLRNIRDLVNIIRSRSLEVGKLLKEKRIREELGLQ